MKESLMIMVIVAVFAGCGEAKKVDNVQSGSEMKAKKMMAQQSSQSPREEIAAGMQFLRDGDLKMAIKSFDEAIRENPRNVEGYLILGQTYMHLKDYNRAIDTFIVATRVAPDNGQAHYLLATNLGLAGNYPMARLQAQKCVEIFRKNKDEENFKRSVALLQGLPDSSAK